MYTSISDILLFQCRKMGIFQFFIDFLPVFSEGRGPKNVLKKKILEKYSKNISYHKKSCFRYQNYVLAILQEYLVYMREPFYKSFLLFFFENPKFALKIGWGHQVFGANVSKILLDPDHLGLKDDKSTKIRWPRIFSPLAQIWPLL